jgi:hypothetical protein
MAIRRIWEQQYSSKTTGSYALKLQDNTCNLLKSVFPNGQSIIPRGSGGRSVVFPKKICLQFTAVPPYSNKIEKPFGSYHQWVATVVAK